MRFLYACLFLILFLTKGFTQNSDGQYPTRFYGPKDYKSGIGNLCFVQDNQGKLFVGNENGVLIHDGANWDKVPLPNGGTILWLDVDENNTIFVAGHDQFGFLRQKGITYEFQTLTHLIPDSIQAFGSIWEIASTSYGTYFRSSKYLFWYHDNVLEILPRENYPGKNYDVIFPVNDTVYVRKRGVGLCKIVGKKLTLIKGGEFFKNVKTNAIMPFGKDILVATRTAGLFVIDKNGTRPFQNELGQKLAEARIYHATTHNDYIALATLTKGVYVLNKKGEVIEHINDELYGMNATAHYVFFDIQNALWIGSVKGIVRVDFNDQFKIFKSIAGRNTFLNQMIKSKGIYYFATTTGIFYSKSKDFKNALKVKNLNNPCNYISEIDGSIYFDGTGGTFTINDQFEAVMVTRRTSVPFPRLETGKLLLGGQEEMATAIIKEDGSFEIQDYLNSGNNVVSAIEFEPGKIWACRILNGITYYELDTDSVMHFPDFGNSTIVTINNDPLFVTDKGVFEYSHNGFKKSELVYARIDSSNYDIEIISTDNIGNILVLYSDQFANIYGKWLEKISKYNYQDYALPDFDLKKEELAAVYLEDSGKVWVAKHNELLLIDAKQELKQEQKLDMYISSVQAGNSKFIPDTSEVYELKENSITFNYAARYYNSYGDNQYQFMLAGLESDWSDWSESFSKEYSYLREGRYSFKVRAQNPHKIYSDVVSFDFIILPPWYRSIWAYLSTVVLIFVAVIIYVKLRSKKLMDENRKLETLVNERTLEVATKNKKLEEINSLKSKFFANISHELRTPLTLINGQFEALESQKSSKDTKERITYGKRNVAQLKNMIEDLLDLSKLELGQNLVNPRPIVINSIFSRMTYSFHSFAEKKGIELTYNDDFSNDVIVKLDVRQIEKVINNLLFNAIKFTNLNGKVTLEALIADDYLNIHIKDSGSGIPQSELPYIFDRFYQAKNQGSEPGSGLGLAIAKEIIDLHGGEISVSSILGSGTVFTILFPLVSEEIQKEEIPEEDLSVNDFLEKHIFLGERDRPKILIVEDNEEMSVYLKEILSDSFNISEAGNGVEALKWLQLNDAQLIISDVMMPKMGGFELLDKLKQSIKLKNIPVILLTARSAQEDRLHGLRFGVDDYITKPFDREELLIRAVNLIKNLQSRVIIAKDDIKEEQDESKILVSQEDEKMIKTAEAYIESRIADSSLSVREVATSVAMSERQFYRKIRQVTGMTPSHFMMEIRLHYAHKLLLDGEIVKLSQVSSDVGINSTSYFSKLFFERFGKKPSAYINR